MSKKYPIIYFQLIKIRDIWKRSSSTNKVDMIELLTSTIEQIERDYI